MAPNLATAASRQLLLLGMGGAETLLLRLLEIRICRAKMRMPRHNRASRMTLPDLVQ